MSLRAISSVTQLAALPLHPVRQRPRISLHYRADYQGKLPFCGCTPPPRGVSRGVELIASLSTFIERYGTEALCEKVLERSRWPHGFVCPHCGEREHSRFLADGRQYWQGSKCRTQNTVRDLRFHLPAPLAVGEDSVHAE
jgi:hypothetical protein